MSHSGVLCLRREQRAESIGHRARRQRTESLGTRDYALGTTFGMLGTGDPLVADAACGAGLSGAQRARRILEEGKSGDEIFLALKK